MKERKEKSSTTLNKGFTLIEMLIVVLIIGILAAIALPQYKLAVLKSKYATMKDIVRVVKEAQQRYYMVNNDYTINFNDLDIEYNREITGNGTNLYINDFHCSLDWWHSPNQGIICILHRPHRLAYYTIYGKNISVCRVMDLADQNENTLEDKVCKLETDTSPTYNNGSNVYLY